MNLNEIPELLDHIDDVLCHSASIPPFLEPTFFTQYAKLSGACLDNFASCRDNIWTRKGVESSADILLKMLNTAKVSAENWRINLSTVGINSVYEVRLLNLIVTLYRQRGAVILSTPSSKVCCAATIIARFNTDWREIYASETYLTGEDNDYYKNDVFGAEYGGLPGTWDVITRTPREAEINVLYDVNAWLSKKRGPKPNEIRVILFGNYGPCNACKARLWRARAELTTRLALSVEIVCIYQKELSTEIKALKGKKKTTYGFGRGTFAPKILDNVYVRRLQHCDAAALNLQTDPTKGLGIKKSFYK